MLRLSNITKEIDGMALYQRVSLTAEPGERIALIGANGIGKTTLLKVIAETWRPDQGSVWNTIGTPSWYQEPDLHIDGSWGERAWKTLAELS